MWYKFDVERYLPFLGYKYAGLQAASYCLCGDSYGNHGKALESQCSMTCSGESSQICGDDMTNSIYTTGYMGK